MNKNVSDHFEEALEMISIGSLAERPITRLAANIFIATQNEEKLKRDQIKGKLQANQTHYEIGKKVRKTIEEIGGTMPDNLPVASKPSKKPTTPKP